MKSKGTIWVAAFVAALVGVLGITVARAAPDDDPGTPLKAALDLERGDETVEVVDAFQADVAQCMTALGQPYYGDAATIPPELAGAALEQYTVALVGTEAAPGCLGQSMQAYAEAAPPPADATFFKRAEARPAYKAALKSWLKCMANKGFATVATPDAVPAAETAIIASGGTNSAALGDAGDACLSASGLAAVQADIIAEYEALGG